MKFALFCPRLADETPEAWERRRRACRDYLREHPQVHAIEFDSLDELERGYDPRAFRRVVVARRGYYSLAFHDWVARHRVSVLDVLDRAAGMAA